MRAGDAAMTSLRGHKNYTLADKRAQLEIQGNKCANPRCSRRVSPDDEALTFWHIDHDHACCGEKRSCAQCRRGILCQPCNVALGLMRDNPAAVYGLAEYAARTGAPVAVVDRQRYRMTENEQGWY